MSHPFMRWIVHFVLAAGLVLAWTPVNAQVREPMGFDIAGIKLGMSSDQAMKALRAAGYGSALKRDASLEPDDYRVESFAYLAYREAERQLGRGLPEVPHTTVVSSLTGMDAGGNVVRVAFRDWPDGTRVHAITFEAGDAMRTRSAEIDAQVRSKYGTPSGTATKDGKTFDFWCSPGVAHCSDPVVSPRPRLLLQKEATGRRTLTLFIGSIEDSKPYRLVETEGAKIAAAVKAGKNPADVSIVAAAATARHAARRDPSTFDIGGAKLGMTPDQATAALAAAGFSPSTQWRPSPDLSYDQAIDVRAKEFAGDRRYYPDVLHGLGQLTFEHPSGGLIRVAFINPPEGPRVSSIHYEISAKKMDRKTFVDRVAGKYGQATLTNNIHSFWCTKAVGACSNISDVQNGLYLAADQEVNNQGKFTIVLGDGGGLEQKLRTAIDAEAKRRAGGR